MDSASLGLIVGTGARTPVGLTAASTAAAVRAGIARIAEHPFMLDKRGQKMIVGRVPRLALDLARSERLLGLALPAAEEALIPLLAVAHSRPGVNLYLSLPEGLPGRSEQIGRTFAQQLVETLRQSIRIQEVELYQEGHAGGLLGVERALRALSDGRSELCLIGGVDSWIDAETLEWLDEQDLLHSEKTIWGFCPSEGAGFCLLAAPRFAASLDLGTPAKIVSAGSALEDHVIGSDSVCIGAGLSDAFRRTLSYLPQGCYVDHSICDMNGEPYRADEYGFAMMRSANKFDERADFETPASCWGDVGAASGPLFLVLSAFAHCKGYSPGPSTLLWTSSRSGLRSAALVQSATTA